MAFVLDEIYGLIEGIEGEREYLRSAECPAKVDAAQVINVIEATELLSQFGYENRFGLSAMDLNKVLSYRGLIRTDVLLRQSERLVSLLREFEGEINSELNSIDVRGIGDSDVDASLQEVDKTKLEFRSIETKEIWVSRSRLSTESAISRVSEILEEVVLIARNTNLPPEQRAFSELERAKLIAMFETAIAVLKAPLVPKTFLKKIAESAKDGVTSFVKKNSEKALTYAILRAVEELIKLLA